MSLFDQKITISSKKSNLFNYKTKKKFRLSKLKLPISLTMISKLCQTTMKIKSNPILIGWQNSRISLLALKTGFTSPFKKMTKSERISKLKFQSKELECKTLRSSLPLFNFSIRNMCLTLEARFSWQVRHWSENLSTRKKPRHSMRSKRKSTIILQIWRISRSLT